MAEHIIYDFIPALWGQVSENRNTERIISDRYFKELLQLVSFIAGMCGQIPSQSPCRGSAKTRYERVSKKMRTRDVAKGLNFLTMGRRNVLRAFSQTFSFYNKVYRSSLVFAETPA